MDMKRSLKKWMQVGCGPLRLNSWLNEVQSRHCRARMIRHFPLEEASAKDCLGASAWLRNPSRTVGTCRAVPYRESLPCYPAATMQIRSIQCLQLLVTTDSAGQRFTLTSGAQFSLKRETLHQIMCILGLRREGWSISFGECRANVTIAPVV